MSTQMPLRLSRLSLEEQVKGRPEAKGQVETNGEAISGRPGMQGLRGCGDENGNINGVKDAYANDNETGNMNRNDDANAESNGEMGVEKEDGSEDESEIRLYLFGGIV